MIVQAIGLLDDLDKELNTYAMRVREWYGWHFPEMGKVVQDNVDYAKVVKFMGMRAAAAVRILLTLCPQCQQQPKEQMAWEVPNRNEICRTAAEQDLDFSEILAEEVEDLLKEAAVVSMGTEISQQDIENITHLCDQVRAFHIALSLGGLEQRFRSNVERVGASADSNPRRGTRAGDRPVGVPCTAGRVPQKPNECPRA
eukprot:scaffold928_cov370-Prasinococcus_capsulatus_cf.AAC.29